MSAAQIPWALVPGGTLPKAPASRLACDYCPAVAIVHETNGAGTVRACEAHKGLLPLFSCTCGSGGHPRRCLQHPEAFAEHVAELNAPDPEDARSDAEALAALKALDKGTHEAEDAEALADLADLASTDLRYTQAQWDERGEILRAVCEQRDKALMVATPLGAYTQAQWDAAYLEAQGVIGRVGEERDAARRELQAAVRDLTEERDRALMRAQKAEDAARFWESEAKAWEADWRALPESVRGRQGPVRPSQ